MSAAAPVERRVLDADDVDRALRRIAVEIAERNRGVANVALVGVRRGGIAPATRLRSLLLEAEGRDVPIGSVDITLYRDDAATALPNPLIGPSDIPFDVDDRVLILVDDVLFTGRTTRAAIDAILDYGRPRAIQLAVVIDRGHRELPLHADFVGRAIATHRDERVEVRLEGETPNEVVVISPR